MEPYLGVDANKFIMEDNFLPGKNNITPVKEIKEEDEDIEDDFAETNSNVLQNTEYTKTLNMDSNTEETINPICDLDKGKGTVSHQKDEKETKEKTHEKLQERLQLDINSIKAQSSVLTITPDYLLTHENLGICNQKKSRHESMDHFLRRVTHLNLNSKKYTKIQGLDILPNLKVLYLYDNAIKNIEFLKSSENTLTHLYLGGNSLKTLENIAQTKLSKLFVDGNQIDIVNGLNNAFNLVELHIANQQFTQPTHSLMFDHMTVHAISGSLKVLNVAGNNIDDLGSICRLYNLEKINASKNNILDLKQLQLLFASCQYIQEADFRGNPVVANTPKNKYRDQIVLSSSQELKLLDGSQITPILRMNVQRLKMHKLKMVSTNVNCRKKSTNQESSENRYNINKGSLVTYKQGKKYGFLEGKGSEISGSSLGFHNSKVRYNRYYERSEGNSPYDPTLG